LFKLLEFADFDAILPEKNYPFLAIFRFSHRNGTPYFFLEHQCKVHRVVGANFLRQKSDLFLRRLPHLTAMFDTGLFINDLSLHDNSRDLVLAGTQTSAELKLALDQEQVKSKKLEDNMKKLGKIAHDLTLTSSERTWLERGTVGFLVQMCNSSCASICASNGRYVDSTYRRHVFLSNMMKFLTTLSSH
jgi:hypothetical protein